MAERPLEVLHVLETLGHGGAEQNLATILARLPREQFRHHLAWLYGEDGPLLDTVRPHVASLIRLRAGPGLGLAAAALRLTSWLRERRPDVVHAQLLRAQLVARAGARAAGQIPVVTTWQNAYYDESALADFAGSVGLRATIRALDRVSGRTDRRFVAVSEHVASHCCAHLGVDPSRVTVVYNAVEPARYAPVAPAVLAATREALGLGPGDRVLLSVGRLVEQKGQLELVRALPAVRARQPGAVLLIAGAGPLEHELRRQAEALGVAAHVRLLGRRADVPALYQLADAFVFPSRYEGLSVALVEALSNGLPAVVSDIPQNREVGLRSAAVRYVPVGDVAALGRAMVEVLEDGGFRRAAQRDAEVLRGRFAPEALADRFGAVLSAAVR